MGDRPLAVGLDVGGTKIAAGLVTGAGQILSARRVPTPTSERSLITTMIDLARELRDEAGTALPIGVGFPAMVTREGVARYGPNICLVEYPLGQVLRDSLGGTVALDNDATAATWAEFRLGAGRDAHSDMLMFTLGTGVGGGIIAGGRILHGANGFAGDVGHLIIDIDGEPGPSGVPGELEAYSSGTALGRLAAAAAARGAFAGTSLDGVQDLDGATISQAAQAGNQAAIDVLAVAGRHLGIAAAGLVNCLDSEMVVVGGGAAEAPDLILGPARDAFAVHVLGPAHRPPVPIVPAALGGRAGLIGAGLLAMDAVNGIPVDRT